MKDIYGNWFLSKLLFETEKEAAEEAAFIIEYDFVHSVLVIRDDDKESKNVKSYIN
jgi:hypothetical protein